MNVKPPSITGVILAGGRGQRMGGQDKGLIAMAGKPLVFWVAERLAPQVDEVLIVANRNLQGYAELGYRVVSDHSSDFLGPLAGFEAALCAAQTSWIVTCPVDAPQLAHDYVQRLWLHKAKSMVATASCQGRLQPAHCLLHRESLESLRAFLDAGDRKVAMWLERLPAAVVDLSCIPECFQDADTPEQLADIEAALKLQKCSVESQDE